MPELPEVETIKNELLPHIVGRTITNVDVFWDKMVRQPSIAEFKRRVIGRKINSLSRRGKYLFFQLSGDGVLVMHMKMTGSLLVNPSDARFSRAIFHLDNGAAVHFWDPRKFGVMWLAEDESAVEAMLGPEPLEAAFTPAALARIFRNRTAPVKAVILDQSVIAGIGNMYADEALFEARIHPLRPAGRLSADEIKRLHRAIRHVLRRALAKGGASVRNYIRPDGAPGTAHDEFVVAHGVGKACPDCGRPIERIVIRGRGTYICPRCQRYP
jgi:formamidopyrimidine-DNA glycosylase